MSRISTLVMELTGVTLVAGAIASCGPSNDSEVSGGGVGGTASANGGASPSGGTGQVSSGGANTGGKSSEGECQTSDDANSRCDTWSLTMPPAVVQHADPGPWDQTMGGSLSPGTYVLTDLAKHGDPPTCSRSAAAICALEANGRVSHGWEEGIGVRPTPKARKLASHFGGKIPVSRSPTVMGR
jgi:hypothetical protein